ncbi:MAG: hypothetical protein ACREQ9_02935, partial [Candidatus Binatia bacterium]
AWAPAGMMFGKLRIEGPPDERFAVGGLPPTNAEASRYETVSLALDELRAEVASVVAEGRP